MRQRMRHLTDQAAASVLAEGPPGLRLRSSPPKSELCHSMARRVRKSKTPSALSMRGSWPRSETPTLATLPRPGSRCSGSGRPAARSLPAECRAGRSVSAAWRLGPAQGGQARESRRPSGLRARRRGSRRSRLPRGFPSRQAAREPGSRRRRSRAARSASCDVFPCAGRQRSGRTPIAL